MKILYAASEAAPFIKTGGLGDVAYALPQALSQKDENEICVFLPFYSQIKQTPSFQIEFITHFDMPLSWRMQYVGLFKAVAGKVTYYFIDNDYYFGRDGLYGHFDDGERFAYFSKAILESLPYLGFYPDVIEANDWHTALIPLFFKAFYNQLPGYLNIKTVFTIHNIEYQGKVPNEFLNEVLGVDEYWRPVLSYKGCINLMKAAIELSDRISTVSETYAFEIRDPYFSHGLDTILQENGYKIWGITNGIDMDSFDPATDQFLSVNYSAGELENKAQNKVFLQQKLGLPANPDIPVVGMVTRLVEHKGLSLVQFVSHRLATMGIQLVIVGTGDKEFEDFFRQLAAEYPQSVSANILFDPALANQVYAGCDLFLMPSKSEPCGLSQMIAMRYGTLPIVREIGGLVDTVKPVNTETLEGSGFTFKTYNADDMLGAVERAVAFYHDTEKYKQIVTNIMQTDFGWTRSSEKYEQMFRSMN